MANYQNKKQNYSKRKSTIKKQQPQAFNQKEEEQNSNSEIFFGKHVVLSILEEGKQVNKVFLQKGISGESIKRILELVREQGFVCQEVPKTKLDDLTDGQNHQGIAVTMPAFEYSTLEDCLALANARGETPFLLILDGIEDPHNLGSIIRTADATGVHGIIIPKRRSVALTGVVAKTSTGAIEHVPVVRVTNLSQTIEKLKQEGIWVFATAMDGQDMRQWNSNGPVAIIIGNEGQGVSPLVQSTADETIMIPMVGHVQSLNASVAASILMYEVARKRMPLA